MKWLFISFVIAPLLSFSQANLEKRKKGELIINGTISNKKDSVHTIYAMFVDGDKKEGIVSAKVIDGGYKFRVFIGVTTLVTLLIKNPNSDGAFKDKNMLVFLSEPATVFISSTDSFSNALISGSKAYREYKKLEVLRDPYSKELSNLYKNYALEKNDNNSKGMEQTQRSIDSVNEALAQKYRAYIRSNPSSPALMHAVNRFIFSHKYFSAADINELNELHTSLTLVEKNSYYGKRLEKKLQSFTISIGLNAPLFVQNDTLGNPVSLESFKGKYVLVDFWASWCIPCRKANPDLVKAYNKYKDKGFTIVSISLDKPGDEKKWIEAIQKDRLTWTHLSDLKYWDNGVAKLYKVDAIPKNFLIDPQGKIIEKDLFENELEEKLKTIVK